MFVIVTRWEQAAEGQLLAHRGLRIAADTEQGLGAVAVVFGGAQRTGEGFATGLGHQCCGAVGGAGRWHLGLDRHPGNARHQRGVALERLAGQRPLGLNLRRQFVEQGFDPADIALDLDIADVAFHQHHARYAVIEILLRQERVGQQVTVLLIASGDVARGFDQLGERGLPADQGLIDFGEFVERVEGAAFDLHGLQFDLGVHQQRLRSGGTSVRHLHRRGAWAIGIGRQVRHRQIADGFVAVEKAGQGVGEGGGTETEEQQGCHYAHRTLHGQITALG
ncbi:hypothetical protein D3C72_499300 [compost metagenome]